MNLLLDTQIFIWAFGYPEKLPQRMQDAVYNKQNRLFLSVATVWEIQIKSQIGKLTLPMNARKFVETQCRLNDIQLLPILSEHVWMLDKMPLHHRDPFDRMIIAQAVSQKLLLVSVDRQFPQYKVKLF